MTLTPSPRIFLYSHDTFGLGHLRRNRKIAAAIRQCNPNAQIRLATGSELAGKFAPLPDLELIHLPPVKKNSDGSYQSPVPGQTIEELLALRSTVLKESVAEQPPDILIADKEPLGLLGELDAALAATADHTFRILGLRDVLDAPHKLHDEWRSRGVIERLDGLYDEIWIYGPEWFHAPLAGLGLSDDILATCRHVGFLGTPQAFDQLEPDDDADDLPDKYILVTAGGGEDGENLMRQVLAACAHSKFEFPLVLLSGPLLPPPVLKQLNKMAAAQHQIRVLTFRPETSRLIKGAAAVVAMCGYNTFCEILEVRKPVLFVPRERPRQEQSIRARRAAEFGAATVMYQDDAADPSRFASAIEQLTSDEHQQKAQEKFEFEGLANIGERVSQILRNCDRVTGK